MAFFKENIRSWKMRYHSCGSDCEFLNEWTLVRMNSLNKFHIYHPVSTTSVSLERSHRWKGLDVINLNQFWCEINPLAIKNAISRNKRINFIENPTLMIDLMRNVKFEQRIHLAKSLSHTFHDVCERLQLGMLNFIYYPVLVLIQIYEIEAFIFPNHRIMQQYQK